MPESDAQLAGAVHDAWVAASSLAFSTGETMVARLIEKLAEQGYVIVRDEPDHFVTFDEDGWFIEHSVACRVAGTIGTCAYNQAIREIADEPDPGQMGRWRITEVDSEGLPSLERADG